MKLKVVHFSAICYFADTPDINSNQDTCWISRFVVTVNPEAPAKQCMECMDYPTQRPPGLSKTSTETGRCISRKRNGETGYCSARLRSCIFLVWRKSAESPGPPCTRGCTESPFDGPCNYHNQFRLLRFTRNDIASIKPSLRTK